MSIVTLRDNPLEWIARQGDRQPFTMNFSVSVADREFEAYIKRIGTGGATVVTLSEDNGKIVNNGSSLSFLLDGDNADIPANTYEWSLRDVTNDITLFFAPFKLYDSTYRGSTTSSADVTLNLGDVVVNVELTIGGDTDTCISIRSKTFNASGGSFPSTGGRHTAGAPKEFDAWIVGTAGTIVGQELGVGAIIMANKNSPDSNWTSTGWSLLRL